MRCASHPFRSSPECRVCDRVYSAHYRRANGAKQSEDRRVPPGWRDDALCRQFGPDVFCPSPPRQVTMRAVTKEARQVCQGCPVIRECATEALSHTPFGVWAGLPFSGQQMTGVQRAELRQIAGFGEAEAS